MEIEYLLSVRDDTRQGALRYALSPGDPLAVDEESVPRLVNLNVLLSLTDDLMRDPDLDTDVRDLIAAGSSLGGARPKASVLDADGTLMIAKFPKVTTDEWDVPGWEKLTLDMADDAGIDVPRTRLVRVLDRNVLLLARFDRDRARRVGYISAITLAQANDGDHTRGYADVADFLEPAAQNPDRDLPQLYRRALFGLLVSNTDNHLRNLGFLRGDAGWSLSPAFDINPNPRPAPFATAVGSGAAGSEAVAEAVEWSEYFRVTRADAIDMLGEIVEVTSTWRARAVALGLLASDIARMDAAFNSARAAEARQILRARGRPR